MATSNAAQQRRLRIMSNFGILFVTAKIEMAQMTT
jgi:hypothetical protein